MLKSHNQYLDKPMYILSPGEHFATTDDCVIGTVTGSCVVVCLFDTLRRLGGMRHIIVPGALGAEEIYRSELGSYAINSMEHLFGDIVKLGGDRKFLKAKIFGAAYLTDVNSKMHGISLDTIKFLHEYFSYEKIPVISEDLGGKIRRKIYFIPATGKAYRKMLTRNENSSVYIQMEQEYINSAFKEKDTYGKVILFE